MYTCMHNYLDTICEGDGNLRLVHKTEDNYGTLYKSVTLCLDGDTLFYQTGHEQLLDSPADNLVLAI